MSILLSVATSSDGYIDDNNPERLILSSPEDWAEVYSLRAAADAIVIGAETLRRDNPRLSLKSDSLCERRVSEGRTPEPHRVIISRRGSIDPSLRLFSSPYKNIIIFSEVERPELEGCAEVIVAESITAALVVSELESRALHEIMVEGGAQILSLFLAEGCADLLRIATNPNIVVDCSDAPRFERPASLRTLRAQRSSLGGVEVELFTLRERHRAKDVELLRRAIEVSKHCVASATSYCVGAVVATKCGKIFEGYTHETSPTHHAEQEAIAKAERSGVSLEGATIYSSMEPCSTRSSEPESCSAIIIRHRFSRAIFALYEPNCFVHCTGALNMRLAGVDVECIACEAQSVREINGHLLLGGE